MDFQEGGEVAPEGLEVFKTDWPWWKKGMAAVLGGHETLNLLGQRGRGAQVAEIARTALPLIFMGRGPKGEIAPEGWFEKVYPELAPVLKGEPYLPGAPEGSPKLDLSPTTKELPIVKGEPGSPLAKFQEAHADYQAGKITGEEYEDAKDNYLEETQAQEREKYPVPPEIKEQLGKAWQEHVQAGGLEEPGGTSLRDEIIAIEKQLPGGLTKQEKDYHKYYGDSAYLEYLKSYVADPSGYHPPSWDELTMNDIKAMKYNLSGYTRSSPPTYKPPQASTSEGEPGAGYPPWWLFQGGGEIVNPNRAREEEYRQWRGWIESVVPDERQFNPGYVPMLEWWQGMDRFDPSWAGELMTAQEGGEINPPPDYGPPSWRDYPPDFFYSEGPEQDQPDPSPPIDSSDDVEDYYRALMRFK